MYGGLKRIFSLIFVLVFCGMPSVLAQKIKVEVNLPSLVAVGEAFRLEYSVNGEPEEFIPPVFNGFEVIAGPTTSHGKQVSIVGGTVTQTVEYAYTYALMAKAEGKYTIPAAKIKIDGQTYSSQEALVEVVTADAINNIQNNPTAETSVSDDDLLVRVIVNRNSVYKGQPVKVTFKLYSRLPHIQGYQNVKFPTFNGFWAQDLDVSGSSPRRETYRNKVYETYVIKESLLFPQQSGELFIEQFTITVLGQIVVRNARQGGGSLLDEFFGGGPTTHNITRSLSAPPVRITVKDFPAGAPANFNGAVGKFNLAGELEKNSLSANSSNTYSVTVSGTGNLPLISAPKLSLPSSFEQYNMKTTESLSSNTVNGISGYRKFEHPFIPRGEGDYTIEPVEFSYFDPETQKYNILRTSLQQITVLPDSTGGGQSTGLVSGISKEDVRMLDKDIRFIRTGNPRLHGRENMLFGSWLYYGILAAIALLSFAVCKYLKRYLKDISNTTLVRNKKANKVALTHLKTAKCFMDEGAKNSFYEEMLKALWGYMGDKLNIPVSNLTKDNIREELARRNIPHDTVNRFVETISECEYAQYSLASPGQMHDIYNSAAAILSKLESTIKK